MFFFRTIEPPAFGPGGKKPPRQTVPSWGRIVTAIALLVLVVGAAFYAKKTGWDPAAEHLLDLAKVGGGMLFGVLLGEKTGSSEK
jgi:hypothetical protein